MMIRNLIFALLAFGSAFGLTTYVYTLNEKINAEHEEVRKLRVKLLLNDGTLQTQIEKQKTDYTKLSEQVSILDEAVSPNEKRWAKIKKVRKAIQDVIRENGYPSYLDINGLTNYASAVVDYSEQFDVSIPLVLAITTRESAFNPKAISHAGAEGLMQMMPETAKECSNDLNKPFYNMYKIRDSVQFGTWYLWKLTDIFKGDLDLAIRAYNAGPTNVRKVQAKEDGYENYYKETIEYHDAVTKWKKRYEDLGL